MLGNNSLAAKGSLLIGAAYVAVGILGFIYTGFNNFTQDTSDSLLGIASINPAHNLVHIAVGAILIIATRFSTPVNEGVLMGVGLFYIVAFVIGFVDTTPVQVGDKVDSLTIISMNGSGDGENFIHLLTGTVALAIGLISSAATSGHGKRGGLPA